MRIEIGADWVGLSFEETRSRLSAAGIPPVHAAAVWKALYRSEGRRFRSATDVSDGPASTLPARLRDALDASRGILLGDPAIARQTISTDGLTEKFLLTLADGQQVETVIMGYPGRFTACISTQAGCAMGCVFCATGQMGFVRHLSTAEIVRQVRFVVRRLEARGEHLRNIVLMGMGEPLHNYDNVMAALAIVSEARAFGISPARITVNTVGVVPGILRMASEGRPYRLGVSLHGVNEEERTALVPAGRRWPLADLLGACRTYTATTGRKIFVGWTLIEGVNDSPAHAARLADLLLDIEAHVNLIELNQTAGYDGRQSARAVANAFSAVVQAAGIPCTIRQRRGIDVAAGCGQLRAAAV